MVDCSLRIWSELLPQEKEFKYHGVLFMSKMECKIDRQISLMSAVHDCCGEKGTEPEGKALNYQSITHGHKPWVVTEK